MLEKNILSQMAVLALAPQASVRKNSVDSVSILCFSTFQQCNAMQWVAGLGVSTYFDFGLRICSTQWPPYGAHILQGLLLNCWWAVLAQAPPAPGRRSSYWSGKVLYLSKKKYFSGCAGTSPYSFRNNISVDLVTMFCLTKTFSQLLAFLA